MDSVRAAGARGAALRAPAARLMAPDAAAVQVLRGGPTEGYRRAAVITTVATGTRSHLPGPVVPVQPCRHLALSLAVATLCASWAPAQAQLPPHSWERVPTYAFCAPSDRAMNATELSWLQGRAPPHTAPPGAPSRLHRPHWIALGYVTESAAPMPPGHSEAKQISVARQIRSPFPTGDPSMYVLPGTGWDIIFTPKGNATHAMFDVDDAFNRHTELELHCNGTLALRPDGTRVHDWAQLGARQLWASAFQRFAGSGSLRGAFLDGIGRCRKSEQPAPANTPANGCGASAGYDINSNPNCSAAKKAAWSAGEALAIAAVRAAVGPGNLTICNGHDTVFEAAASSYVDGMLPRPSSTDDLVVWPPSPRWCNGNFQEEWQGFAVDVLLLLRAAAVPDYVSAVRSIGYTVDRAGDTAHSFARTLAAFLVAAQNHSYYLHYLGYDCGNSGQMVRVATHPVSLPFIALQIISRLLDAWRCRSQDYHSEYQQPLGPPRGNATGSCIAPDGPCELRRVFGRGVSVFYRGNATQGKEQTCIRWGDGSLTEYGGGCTVSGLRNLPPPRVQINRSAVVARLPGRMTVGGGIEDINHELTGALLAQMVSGESFEESMGPDGISGSQPGSQTFSTWHKHGVGGLFAVVRNGTALTGLQSQLLTASAALGCASVVNFGIDNVGMALHADAQYEGYTVVRCTNANAAILRVDFVNLDGVIGGNEVELNCTGTWELTRFSLRANASTTCHNASVPRVQAPVQRPWCGSVDGPPPEKACVECGGGVAFSLSSSTGQTVSVELDQVYLSPTETFLGLPIRKDVGELLFTSSSGLQLGALRLGGSSVAVAGYRWKHFRGPPYLRQPYAGRWQAIQSGRWAIFEFLDLCEALNISHACVVNLDIKESPKDIGDLIEYLYGDSQTEWGKKRHLDGRSASYPRNIFIEFGNELPLTELLVEQMANATAAAEQRAAAIGLAEAERPNYVIGQLIFPQAGWGGGGMNWSQIPSMLRALDSLGERALWDVHSSEENLYDGVTMAAMVGDLKALFEKHGSRMRVIVGEEDAHRHDMYRALGTTLFHNRLAQHGSFVAFGPAVTNLVQPLGHNDDGWDAAALLSLPNTTWMTPFGLAHQLISHSAAPDVVDVRWDTVRWSAQQQLLQNSPVDIHAAKTESGLVIRVV